MTKEKVKEEFPCCPKCAAVLQHFSGLEAIPEYLYCPICHDAAYDLDGLFKAPLE